MLFRAIAALVLALVYAAPLAAETAADRLAPRRSFATDIWQSWPTVDHMLADPGFLDIYPEYPRILPPGTFAALRAHGFDTVRIAADPSPLLALWGTDRAAGLIENLHTRVAQAQAAGLKVILDLHTYPHGGETGDVDAILASPAGFAVYERMVAGLAARLSDLDPDRTALELMNEPTEDCDAIYDGVTAPRWPAHLVRLHRAARQAAPDLPLVLSGACWGGADGLVALDPGLIGDDNVIWSFHSYDPFAFSHQGADWTGSPLMFLADLPYPPSRLTPKMAARLLAEGLARARAGSGPVAAAASEAALRQILDDYAATPRSATAAPIALALAWADAHGIPHHRLLLGEFGALWRPGDQPQGFGTPVGPASHARFLRDKRRAAEAAGIGWSVWSFTGSMGIIDPGFGLNPLTCRALGLTRCDQPNPPAN